MSGGGSEAGGQKQKRTKKPFTPKGIAPGGTVSTEVARALPSQQVATPTLTSGTGRVPAHTLTYLEKQTSWLGLQAPTLLLPLWASASSLSSEEVTMR